MHLVFMVLQRVFSWGQVMCGLLRSDVWRDIPYWLLFTHMALAIVGGAFIFLDYYGSTISNNGQWKPGVFATMGMLFMVYSIVEFLRTCHQTEILRKQQELPEIILHKNIEKLEDIEKDVYKTLDENLKTT